jgi:predicted ATP-grasp superfamily ATP-dependent carboligase
MRAVATTAPQRAHRRPSPHLVEASNTRTVDVLVLDAAQRQGLVAVRALGESGLRVGALEVRRRTPAFHSRWCARTGLIPDVARGADAYVDALLEHVSQTGARAVICASDGSLEALRARRADVEQHALLPLPSERALKVAVEKERCLSLASTLGIRIPKSFHVADVRDVDAAVAELGLPLVVKPNASWAQAGSHGARLGPKAVLTKAEAAAAVRDVCDAGGTVLLQELLPGRREAVSLFRAERRIWARFAQVAYRMLPPLGGSSILRESIPMPADAAEAAEALASACDLDGYSEIEFRRDAAGHAVLMEINPRLSASVEIAVRAGVNFPLFLYRWAVGESLQPAVGYRVGLRMRWLGGDVKWLIETFKNQGRPDVLPRSRAVRRFVTDSFRPASYDYVVAGDLGPAALASASFMKWLAGSTSRRITRPLARQRSAAA